MGIWYSPEMEIRINCTPVPWKSHGGFGKNSYNPRAKEISFYRHQIKNQWGGRSPIESAVHLTYLFLMPIPASLSIKKREEILSKRTEHVKRPDVTNLVKLCEDTLKGIVFVDDSQVVSFKASKKYGIEGYTLIYIDLKSSCDYL